MNWIKLSWKNIWFRPLGSSLSIVLLVLSVGLITFLILLNDQLKQKFDQNLAGVDLVIGAKGSPLQLILANMYHVDAPTGNIALKEAKPFLNPKHPLIKKAIPLSLGDSHKGYRIVGTDPSFVHNYNGQIAEGKLPQRSMDAVVGHTLKRNLNIKIGDTFHGSHGLIEEETLVHTDAAPFRVVGILKPSGNVLDQLIITPTQSVWEVHSDHDHSDHDHSDHDHSDHDHSGHDHSGHDHSTQNQDHSHDEDSHGLTPEEGNNEKGWTSLFDMKGLEEKEITSLLIEFKGRNIQSLNMARNINENTNMMAASPAIEMNRLYSLMGVGMDAMEKLVWLIGIVAFMSIFVSMYQSMRQRQYEMAIMRVQGASPRVLFGLVSLEGIILVSIGCGLGLFAGRLAMQLLSSSLQESYKYPFEAWVWDSQSWIIIGVCLLLALLASFIPALSASKMDVHATLSKN